MMPIQGGFNQGIDPNQMKQQMQQKFADADTDQNGSLSISEASEVASANGMDESQFNKMFEKMDSNADGEVSEKEQEVMFAQMEERMQQMQSKMSQMGGFSNQANASATDTLSTLLESLSNDEEDDGDKNEFDQLLKDIESNGMNTDNMKKSMSLINDKVPSVNTFA